MPDEDTHSDVALLLPSAAVVRCAAYRDLAIQLTGFSNLADTDFEFGATLEKLMKQLEARLLRGLGEVLPIEILVENAPGGAIDLRSLADRSPLVEAIWAMETATLMRDAWRELTPDHDSEGDE